MKRSSSNLKHVLALTCLASAALLGLLPLTALGAEPAASLPKVKLRLLFGSRLIHGVNQNDVLAAFKIWAEIVGRNRGFSLEVEPDLYDRLEEVQKRLNQKTLELVLFTTTDYLQLAEGGPLQPMFTPVRKQEALFDDYVLVTRRDRNLSDLAALRGKSVVFYQFGANLGRQWMEVTLGESGLGSVDDFFGTKSENTKSSSVVLPVFFGKFDAAVVNRSSLETMKEMNPQLGTQLQVLTNSPCLSEGVICLHRDFTEVRADLMKGLAELHTEPRGQQILLVFKMSKLVPFKPEHLDVVRALTTNPNGRPTLPERKATATEARGEPKL